ncbi:MAG: OsmC family protein [Bacteroidetes bacterium]|nr:OsmC family protein [Bacteroidota bacterium]
METHYYPVQLNWTNDRQGRLSAPALTETIAVATPPEFAGGMPGIWSPEHLFVAAVSSCLMTTFLAIAANSRLEYTGFSCTATGKLEHVEGKYRITEVELKPLVTVADASLAERALRVLQKAEQHCLISNSVNSKVTMMAEVREAGRV